VIAGAHLAHQQVHAGKTDLGLWLLGAGWARPDKLATSEYLSASATARCAGLGIWRGAARPDYCPPEG